MTQMGKVVYTARSHTAAGGCGKPVDAAQHETCIPSCEAHAKGHDYIFTRYVL
jgi:hypothetical protein